MIATLTLILTCQLIGETVVSALGLPVPGPVLGMVLLFLILLVRGGLPEALDATAGGLLRSLSLLFVPAGAGVILHLQLLSESLLPLGLAIVASTSATIVVTALLMQWLSPKDADPSEPTDG